MSSTLLLLSTERPAPELNRLSFTLITNLNIISTVVGTLTLVLAAWCWFYKCKARIDRLRCRVVMAMSLSIISYSISQISLVGRTQDNESSDIGVRISVFISTFSTVFCGLLVACAIGFDAAVRYGLRSIGLARMLSYYYETGCFVASVVISQVTVHAFGEIKWTGSAVVVQETNTMAFDALIWASESAWVLLSIVVSVLFVGYALVKANKIARYNGGSRNTSMESVLGSAASVQGRVYVSICYVAVFSVVAGFKLGFRASGSQSPWLLLTANICEALHAEMLLVAFLIDICVNINRRPEWLSASASSSMESILGKSDMSSKSFTGWRKSGFIEWNRGIGMAADTKDAKLGMPVGLSISKCYIRSDVSYCESDYSLSNVSFETVPEWCTQSMVMYPLEK